MLAPELRGKERVGEDAFVVRRSASPVSCRFALHDRSLRSLCGSFPPAGARGHDLGAEFEKFGVALVGCLRFKHGWLRPDHVVGRELDPAPNRLLQVDALLGELLGVEERFS